MEASHIRTTSFIKEMIAERLQVHCGNLEIRSSNQTGRGTRVLIDGKEIACVRLTLDIGVDEPTKATITYFPTLPTGAVTA